jgi:hypothetical protein
MPAAPSVAIDRAATGPLAAPPTDAVVRLRPASDVDASPHAAPAIPPLPDPTADAAAEARSTDARTLRRRLRGDLDAIVLKALAKNPRERYASLDQLVDDLLRVRAGQRVRSGTRRPWWRPVLSRQNFARVPESWHIDAASRAAAERRRRTRVGVALSILFILALGSFALWSATRPPPPWLAGPIAVMPAVVSNPVLAHLSEETVRLMAQQLDGQAGVRVVDPELLLERWRRELGDGDTIPLDRALVIARDVGATTVLRPEFSSGSGLTRLVARLYRLDGRLVVSPGAADTSGVERSLVQRVSAALIETIGTPASRTPSGDER